MPTVDELLGPPGTPTVDDLLGPAPVQAPSRIDFELSEAPPTPGEDNATRGFLNSTSVGRVLDAFGQGAKHGWGGRPLGLSDETSQALRDAGMFPHAGDTWTLPLKAFNEGLMQPAAIALDAGLRSLSALATGTAGAIGQVAEEAGAEAPQRLTRDMLMLADTLGIVSGVAPTSVRVRSRSAATTAAEEVKPAAKVEPPVKPHDPLPPSEAAIDKAGNINLDRVSAGEDVKNVIREAAVQGDEFTTARRSEITFEQTQEMADALGMSTEQLAKRKVGEAFNAEEALAARNMLVQSATEVRSAAAAARGGADADVLKFQELVTRHMTIQEQVAGLTAEAGRALAQFRIAAKATGEAQDLSKVIESMGGRGNIMDMAKRIDDFDTPQQLSKFLMDSRGSKFSDKVLEVWINALLSGPQTHVTNTVSNSLVALWRVPETYVAAGIGKVRTALGGADERVMFGEGGARLFGITQGSKDGVIAGWRTFKTEIPTDAATKLEQPRPRAIPGVAGQVVRLPGRALMAEDEFFKAIGYRQELNALAYRQASKEGLRGDAFSARVGELVNNPTEKMVDKARENAQYQTFTTELGATGKAIQAFANSHPAAKVVLPFIRTPTNIVKFALERTPLGAFSKKAKADLSGANGAAARDTRIARITMGTAVGVTTASLAAEGYITGGGPVEPRERAVLMLTGWQPYSVKIGGVYYAYGRLEPLGMIMGLSADVAEIGGKLTGPDEVEADKIGAAVVASASKNIMSKTWARGVADLVKAVTDPDRYGEAYIQRLAGSVVPTASAQIARNEDPYLKDAQSVSDALKARIPGLSTEVLNKRDIWGEQIKLEGSLGPDAISPIYTRQVNEDPVNQELIRLKIWPAPVEKKMKGVELSPQQYDDFQRIAGRLSKMTLDTIVSTPGWASVPEFARRETIKNAIERSRESATALMLAQNPSIIQKAVDLKVKQISK